MALFQSFVGAVRDRVVDVVSQRMEQGLAQGVSTAKELVHKDTHATEDSIGYTWSRETMTGTIHADTPYAYWLELKYPYLRPALLEVGRVFGVTTEAAFTTLPQKYHEKARAHVVRLKGRPRIRIGHRNPR
jgi:hypothetical protein